MVARKADVVVVGAGGFGTSIAFHLARRGAAVVLLDRSAAASETSAMAAGIAMQVHPTEAASRLALDSLALVEGLAATTGHRLDYQQAGSIKVARTAAHARIVHDEIAFGRRLGVAIDPLTAAEAEALAPWLCLGGATAISIVRRDLHFEPVDLPQIYLAAARRLGVDVVEGLTVTGLLRSDGAVTGVETTAGAIAAPIVVIAAGGWSAGLAAAAGCHVPAVPVRHELFVTGPLDGIAPDTPHVRVMDANAYARPYRGGLMFGAYETAPVEVHADPDAPGLPPQLASPSSALAERAAPVLDIIPALAGATAVEVRAGVPTMSPDGTFIVDALPGATGAFVVAGDNVMGLHVSPAVGALLAGWIVDGERPARLAPFGLARFAGRDAAELHLAALAQYATKYQHLDEAVHAMSSDPRVRHLVRYLGGFAPFVVARAEGMWLETTDGRRLLDFSSGQICSTLGHRHPRVMAAVRDALETVVHLDSRMLSEPVLALADRLASLAPAPLTRVMPLSTGAEANEFAIKLAKMHTGRFEIVGVTRAFHGATIGAASSTYLRSRRGFGPLVPGTLAVPAPYAYRCSIRHCRETCDCTCLDAGFELVDQQSVGSLAAMICEPILSSAGVIVPPDGWMARAAEHCASRDMLLIVDEAQTGLGRCGAWFDSAREDVVPEFLTLSKTLGGGIPLSATLTTDEIEADCVAKGLAHNTSHVADPLPAAAGVAGLDVIAEDGLVERAAVLGDHLLARLRGLAGRHETVGDVRGRGLLAGVELVRDRSTREPAAGLAAAVGAEAMTLGLSLHPIPTGPSAHCFRIAPPLTATTDEIDRAVDLLDEALARHP